MPLDQSPLAACIVNVPGPVTPDRVQFSGSRRLQDRGSSSWSSHPWQLASVRSRWTSHPWQRATLMTLVQSPLAGIMPLVQSPLAACSANVPGPVTPGRVQFCPQGVSAHSYVSCFEPQGIYDPHRSQCTYRCVLFLAAGDLRPSPQQCTYLCVLFRSAGEPRPSPLRYRYASGDLTGECDSRGCSTFRVRRGATTVRIASCLSKLVDGRPGSRAMLIGDNEVAFPRRAVCVDPVFSAAAAASFPSGDLLPSFSRGSDHSSQGLFGARGSLGCARMALC